MRSTYSKSGLVLGLILAPALITIFPLEILGISGNLLQRLPIFLDNGIPYLDLVVLVLLALVVSPLIKGELAPRVNILVVPQLFMGVAWWFFPQNLSWNQSISLYLGISSVVAYAIAVDRIQLQIISKTLDKYIYWQTIFSCVATLLLVLHVFGVLTYASSLIVEVNRFEGEGVRLRWDAVRLVERLVVASSVAWAMYRFNKTGKFVYWVVPCVFLLEQLVLSSRGGLVLVIVSVLIPFYIYPLPIKCARKSKNLLLKIFSVVMVLLMIVWIVFSDSGDALIRNSDELFNNESIRSRMRDAAITLFSDYPIFGNGYFDLFATQEWSPFYLQTMLLPIHNMFLHYLVYFGIAGFLLLSGLIVLVALDHYRNYRNSRLKTADSDLVEFSGIAFAVFLAGLYMLAFQTMDRVSFLYFWFFCGIATLVSKVRR